MSQQATEWNSMRRPQSRPGKQGKLMEIFVKRSEGLVGVPKQAIKDSVRQADHIIPNLKLDAASAIRNPEANA